MNKPFDEGISKKNGTEMSVSCLEMNRNDKKTMPHLHYHSYIEILFAVDCDLSVWVNDDEMCFETGDLIIINSYEAHEVYAKHENNGKYYVIKFAPEILRFEKQASAELRYITPLLRDDLPKRRRLDKATVANTEIEKIINWIFTEWRGDEFACEMSIRGGVLMLFSQIIKVWREKGDADLFEYSDEAIRIIYSAAEYCVANFNNVCEADIAKMCNMSYSYFSRIFKKVMRKSFTSYINDLRIDYARRTLLTTDKSITQIAQDAGFSTTSHFIYNFKKKMDCSPLVYKNKLQP